MISSKISYKNYDFYLNFSGYSNIFFKFDFTIQMQLASMFNNL